MSANCKLEDDGFDLVGRVCLGGSSKFVIDFDRLPEAGLWAPALYAFRIGNEVVRIGKAARLICRMDKWMQDVSLALNGDFHVGGTTPWEACEWRKRLKRQKGELWAQRGPADRKALHDRERELINRYDPPLGNDGPCARSRPPADRRVRNKVAAKRRWEQLNCSS